MKRSVPGKTNTPRRAVSVGAMHERRNDGSVGEHSTRLFGILCTYKRQVGAIAFLDLLEGQSHAPDVVVIVDNGSDRSLEEHIGGRRSERIEYRYVDAGHNIGPAGAFRLGFDHVIGLADPADLIIFFDDDDPPVQETQIGRLVDGLLEAIAADASVGGMGISGGTLRPRTGLISPANRFVRIAPVDHLHGGRLPVFTVEALADVDSYDPTFFFGFEELELGRRLRQRGWKLLVDNELMAEAASLYLKKTAHSPPWNTSGGVATAWSRFHKERNLVRILRREHLWTAILVTLVGRHLLKPLSLAARHPRYARDRTLLGVRATVAGLRGRTGIDPRYPPP